MKVTLLVPTLNEVEGMKAIMPRIDRKWVDQIILIDGGSTDGTLEYASQMGYEVVRQSGKGLLNACSEGFLKATGDIIVTFSPDGNSIPELIPSLIEHVRAGSEMVIASRYMDGTKNEDDGPLSRVGNWFFTALLNVLFGGSYTDTLVIFRAYTRSAVERMGLLRTSRFFPLESLVPRLCSWETFASVRALKLKLKILSIPGSEPKRIGGFSKTQYIAGATFLLVMYLRELIFWNVEATPSNVFRAGSGESPGIQVKNQKTG